jgi:hypothetical protein
MTNEQAEREELLKDAARYRFLRNGDDGETWNGRSLTPQDWYDLADEFGESFDQKVDEFMNRNDEL